MKKKLLISLLILLVLGFGIFYVGLAKHKFTKTTHLQLPINTVTKQYSYPGNLVKWFIPFSTVAGSNKNLIIDSATKTISSDQFSIQISNRSIYNTLLTYSYKKNEKQFLLSAVPDTSNKGLTELSITYKDTYFNKWFGNNELIKNAIASFDGFDEFLDDTKRMYGFEINPVKVTDTSFLFTRRTVPLSQRQIATKKIFDDLITYAEKSNAAYNGVRIFYSLKSEDEITLFAGIGIGANIDIPDNMPFENKRMPFEKNLIEATYQGTYAGAERVYEALKAYKEDRNLSTMAIPFQKFITDGYGFADDQVVQLKVYFPVF